MPHSRQKQQEPPSQHQQQQTLTTMINQQENIKVAVRLRPFTQREKERNNKRIVDIQENTVVLYNLNYNDVQLKKFTFDYSYWSHDGFKRDENGVNVPDPSHPNSDRYVGQDKVFDDLGSFLLKNALEGYDSALLTYGQTGSGKSYTVSGYGQNEGILPRFARALFIELEKKVASKSTAARQGDGSGGLTTNRYEVYFSMLEIYNEVVRDLLAKSHDDMMAPSSMVRRGLKVREHPKYGFFVENLTSLACANKDEIESRIEEGQLNKSIAATSMNEMSSRGHTIYEFRIKQYDTKKTSNQQQQQHQGSVKSADTGASSGSGSSNGNSKNCGEEETLTTSVVQLVDLAGSERMAVHVNGQLGGESFIGSRSNTPYPRANAEKQTPRTRTSKAASAAPPSAASSNASSQLSQSRKGQQQQQQHQQNQQQHQQQQQSNLPTIHGSATHLQRFKESVAINQSLSALGNCIQVLSQYSQQLEASSSGNQPKKAAPIIPYRDSVLTKLLNRCCLSGTSKVVLIATLSPIDTNYDDTLSTLRFADRAKQIRTHAIINKVERCDLMNGPKKEKSSSGQTANFVADETNDDDNGDHAGSSTIDAVATPTRSRRVNRRTGGATSDRKRAAATRSNPSLAVKQEQMKRIVSPASRKFVGSNGEKAKNRNSNSSKKDAPRMDAESGGTPDELLDLDELDDIEEGLISSDDSEDGFSWNASKLDVDGSEAMTTEEKIQLFNKMLSNSTALDNHLKSKRPRRSNNGRGGERAGLQRVPIISSTLKKDNPYLSNLNPDEQLTGVIGYILKHGETSVGKSKDCDIVLHGPELRGQHARLIRDDDNSVSIEPILPDASGSKTDKQDSSAVVALMVNGSPVNGRIKLNHCDRLLFGTNAYFVFANNLANDKLHSPETLADLDMVTYDMARNEVLRKYMAESKNEVVLKEIKDYTHRPGTGKQRIRSGDLAKDGSRRAGQQAAADGSSRLLRSLTIQDDPQESASIREETPFEEEHKMGLSSQSSAAGAAGGGDGQVDDPGESDQAMQDQEAIIRERLMEDTYEYTLPVAEVNAVAKEMGIKVQYGLKILTGEEQLSDQLNQQAMVQVMDLNTSADGLSVSSSSLADGTDASDRAESRPRRVAGNQHSASGQEWATHLTRLDGLDIPPALYIRVHFEELGLDFFWSKEKFEARRFKILELYGPWDVAGKSGLVEHLIDQSKYQGDYLIDPFVDNPGSTFVLIGHAQITLTPISHLSDLEDTFDIIDMDDGTVGSVQIQATPCDSNPLPSTTTVTNGAPQDASSSDQSQSQSTAAPPYRVFSEKELESCLLGSPEQLLNKKLIFRLTIKSCYNVPDRFCNIFCQYRLGPDLPTIRTKLVREQVLLNGNGMESSTEDATEEKSETNELTFDHSHYICFDNVNRDIVDFLMHGFLTIQVIGQYKLSAEEQQKPPTVISTIISSINKYKMKIEQQQQQQQHGFNGGGYSIGGGGANYYGSQTGSSKSNRGQSSSGAMNSNSASSVVSTSATVNLFDPQNDDEDGSNSINSLSQENIIDMILTKRKLDRAENQLHYLKRTINIAEHYNKKHIPLKTIKKLLNSYGHELESGSLEEFADVTAKARTSNSKSSACSIQ